MFPFFRIFWVQGWFACLGYHILPDGCASWLGSPSAVRQLPLPPPPAGVNLQTEGVNLQAEDVNLQTESVNLQAEDVNNLQADGVNSERCPSVGYN